MRSLLPFLQTNPAQVLPLCAVVFPEFTPKKQAHCAHGKRMNDDNPLNLPDKSLEITLQDSLDGLEDFTLQMAYATTGLQFEIIAIGNATDGENNLPAKPTPLTLVTASIASNNC